MHESLQMYILLERKFYDELDGDVDFLPKVLIFEKITKNTFFAIFLSDLAIKNTKSQKSLLN